MVHDDRVAGDFHKQPLKRCRILAIPSDDEDEDCRWHRLQCEAGCAGIKAQFTQYLCNFEGASATLYQPMFSETAETLSAERFS